MNDSRSGTSTPAPAELPISDADHRALTAWAADCAERSLSVFEAERPDDTRPRAAIEGAHRYGRGEIDRGPLRRLSWATMAAVRDARTPAAQAAARAAVSAASSAYIHPLESRHQVNHVHAPAIYAALAVELAAGDTSLGDAEIDRSADAAPPAVRELIGRLPAWPSGSGRSRLAMLRARLDAGLRR